MNNLTNYLQTKNKQTCYGCRACEQICPQKAISVVADDEGFLYPVLNESACINCGACKNSCPYDNSAKVLLPTAAYASQNTNKSQLLKSSSGGMFYPFAEKIISENGAVAGCVFDDEFNAKHILAEDLYGLEKMQGSKYVQSDVQNVYEKIKTKLSQGQRVLFTGTPCQVSGLRSFLKKDYENLITVDLICHGVPSQYSLAQYINYTEQMKGKIKNLSFRDKEKNGWNAAGCVTTENGKQILTSSFNDSYYQLFMKGLLFRECCYSCAYAQQKRVSDITIGDYWNASEVLPEEKIKSGMSAVLINTEKGDAFFNSLKGDLFVTDASFEHIVKGNGNLSKPSHRPEGRNEIYKDINNYGYSHVVKKYCKFKRLSLLLRKLMPKGIKKLIKKVLG